jgi:glycogen synthase
VFIRQFFLSRYFFSNVHFQKASLSRQPSSSTSLPSIHRCLFCCSDSSRICHHCVFIHQKVVDSSRSCSFIRELLICRGVVTTVSTTVCSFIRCFFSQTFIAEECHHRVSTRESVTV